MKTELSNIAVMLVRSLHLASYKRSTGLIVVYIDVYLGQEYEAVSCTCHLCVGSVPPELTPCVLCIAFDITEQESLCFQVVVFLVFKPDHSIELRIPSKDPQN